jgi:hypothetical protein
MIAFQILIAVSVPALAVHLIDRYWQRTPAQTEMRLFERFMADARADGLGVVDALAELRLRTAFVRLRRRATELTLEDPRHAEQAIVKAAKEEALCLGVHSQAEARRFIRWAESCRADEILLPEAMKAWHRHLHRQADKVVDRRTPQQVADSIAALGGKP